MKKYTVPKLPAVAQPMFEAPVPFIKCGKKGVICTDKPSFNAWWETLWGYRDEKRYADMRNHIDAMCRKYEWDREMKYDVLVFLGNMAYTFAVAEGGWNPRNLDGYLYKCSLHMIMRESKMADLHMKMFQYSEFESNFDTDSDPGYDTEYEKKRDLYFFETDGYEMSTDFDRSHNVRKVLDILRKRNERHADIIAAILGGMDDNDELTDHFKYSNGAAFRKAKERALSAFKEAWVKYTGRDPDGEGPPGRLKGEKVKYNLIMFAYKLKNKSENEMPVFIKDIYLKQLNKYNYSSIDIFINTLYDKNPTPSERISLNGQVSVADSGKAELQGFGPWNGMRNTDTLSPASQEALTSLSWPRAAA